MYLAGHGSCTRPRLIELQYRRIQRYHEALRDHLGITSSVPDIFIDFRLPTYGMGSVNLVDVPGFRRLHRCVKNGRFDIVFIDLDETREGLTPDYESSFVRSLLENAGAKVFNAFSDDGGVFKSGLEIPVRRFSKKLRSQQMGPTSYASFRLWLAISLLHR